MTSKSARALMRRIRFLIGDEDTEPRFNLLKVFDAIDRAQFMCLSDLPTSPAEWVPMVTLANDQWEYDVTMSAEIKNLAAFRLASIGTPIFRVTPSQLQMYRYGTVVVKSAYPAVLSMLEKNAFVYRLQFWPTPSFNTTVDALRSDMPTPLGWNAETDPDTSTLVGAEMALRAIEYLAAAELVRGTPLESSLRADYEKAHEIEAERIYDQQTALEIERFET